MVSQPWCSGLGAAFIFGVIPLAVATGAGSEMRQVLGTAMFFGMLGVTGFGLLFTPLFYVVVRRAFGGRANAVSLKAGLVTQTAARPEHA